MVLLFISDMKYKLLFISIKKFSLNLLFSSGVATNEFAPFDMPRLDSKFALANNFNPLWLK